MAGAIFATVAEAHLLIENLSEPTPVKLGERYERGRVELFYGMGQISV